MSIHRHEIEEIEKRCAPEIQTNTKTVNVVVTEVVKHDFDIELPEDQANQLLSLDEWSSELNDKLHDLVHNQSPQFTISDGNFENGEITEVTK